jgi:hypothetical protein
LDVEGIDVCDLDVFGLELAAEPSAVESRA